MPFKKKVIGENIANIFSHSTVGVDFPELPSYLSVILSGENMKNYKPIEVWNLLTSYNTNKIVKENVMKLYFNDYNQYDFSNLLSDIEAEYDSGSYNNVTGEFLEFLLSYEQFSSLNLLYIVSWWATYEISDHIKPGSTFMKKLVRKSIDEYVVQFQKSRKRRDHYVNNLYRVNIVHITAWLGDLNGMKRCIRLFNYGRNIDIVDEFDRTPLFYACTVSKKRDMIEWLLDRGANPYFLINPDFYGDDPNITNAISLYEYIRSNVNNAFENDKFTQDRILKQLRDNDYTLDPNE